MKKKVVAMFLAAVMALSLVACGSKTDNGGSGDASGTETIKLGGVGPLTGGYANYGLSVQHGAERSWPSRRSTLPAASTVSSWRSTSRILRVTRRVLWRPTAS